MKQVFTLFLIVFFSLQGFPKRKIGAWQDYLSYAKTFKVAKAGEKIYCASEGGLFYYDTSDNSVNKLDGFIKLSDFGIKTIAYSDANGVLVVAYKNSNVDLIFDNGMVFNLSDIKRKSIMGNKTINNILFVNDVAYLSCGFGIVAINLTRREVKDTYKIGEDGGYINVFDMGFDGQELYAATENGIYHAAIDEPNLLDYKSWHRFENIPDPTGTYYHIAFHGGRIIVAHTTGRWKTNNFYLFNNGNWEPYLPQLSYAFDMQVAGGYMTVSASNDIFIIDSDQNIVKRLNNYPLVDGVENEIAARSSIYLGGNSLWIADYNLGLIKGTSDVYESIFPDGPLDNSAFYLYTNENDLFVASGGRTEGWNNVWKAPKLQKFTNNSWTYYTKREYPEMGKFWDIVTVVADPSDPGHIFVGSWGGGLLEFNNDKLTERYTPLNSSLQTALESDTLQHYIRIGGMDFDSQGNLWITNSEVPNVLCVKRSNGEWESYSLPEIANNKSIGQLIVTQNDDKWIVVPRGHNLYVVKNDLSEKTPLKVQSYFNNGETELITEMSDVFSIAEDLDGAIWVGTSKGVAVYFSPQRLWETGTMFATQPSLDLNDGLYHPLLEKEIVTAIAVDGANRKWMGTNNSGVFLISENGEKEIEHFTTENSPLLSNMITSIAINNHSGEVFIGTGEGIISYQGDATQGGNDYANVYVYPNPIRETYSGPIVVTGLVAESDVKITDISGNLVFQTTSSGGQAIWNGKNLNGKRVKTGVYLVFCNGPNGEKTHISKLLFIN